MPFINDRLEESKEIAAQEKHNKTPDRPSRFRFEPDKCMQKLRARIVGQDAALDAIDDMLFRVKADFSDSHRPLSVIFFLGPTGVGKTETVRVLAESILGGTEKLCRIDMNTLAQEHYSAAITGSPPGYVGSKEGQTLFNVDNIRGTFSEPGIVLFDEIEKADKDVVRAILNIFDTGKLILSSGAKELDFSNTLIFMTSNIGARDVANHIARYQTGWRRWLKLKPKSTESILDRSLREHFDPEFLNRIDEVIAFDPLHKNLVDRLIGIELDKLNTRLNRREASIALEPSVYQFLSRDYDERFGARDLSRRLRRELEPKIARAMLNYPDQEKFYAKMEEGSIVALPLAVI